MPLSRSETGAEARLAEPAWAAPKRERGRPNSRELMLDAAQEVVLEFGAARLTLDAVAKRAGVSKGGVMYNFPTKEALLSAMIERVVAHNREAHARLTAELPAAPGRSLKAYVLNSVRALDLDDRVSGALLAALSSAPALLAPVTAYFRSRFVRIASDVPFESAALIYLATEGLWVQELLQLSPFTSRQRGQVVRLLRRLADEAAGKTRTAKKRSKR